MGLDVGVFGPIEYLDRPTEKVKDFFFNLADNQNFCAGSSEGNVFIFATIGDLLDEAKEFTNDEKTRLEIIQYITETLEPKSDLDGFIRLYLNF